MSVQLLEFLLPSRSPSHEPPWRSVVESAVRVECLVHDRKPRAAAV